MSVVLAIGKDENLLHVGTFDDLLPHLDITSNPVGGTPVADLASEFEKHFDIYDDDGSVLRIDVNHANGPRLETDPNVTDQADGQGLVDRVAVFLARLQVLRNENPTTEIDARIPQLQGPLKVVAAALAEAFGDLRPADNPPPPPNKHNAYHQWLHDNNIPH